MKLNNTDTLEAETKEQEPVSFFAGVEGKSSFFNRLIGIRLSKERKDMFSVWRELRIILWVIYRKCVILM